MSIALSGLSPRKWHCLTRFRALSIKDPAPKQMPAVERPPTARRAASYTGYGIGAARDEGDPALVIAADIRAAAEREGRVKRAIKAEIDALEAELEAVVTWGRIPSALRAQIVDRLLRLKARAEEAPPQRRRG